MRYDTNIVKIKHNIFFHSYLLYILEMINYYRSCFEDMYFQSCLYCFRRNDTPPEFVCRRAFINLKTDGLDFFDCFHFIRMSYNCSYISLGYLYMVSWILEKLSPNSNPSWIMQFPIFCGNIFRTSSEGISCNLLLAISLK